MEVESNDIRVNESVFKYELTSPDLLPLEEIAQQKFWTNA